MNQSRPRSAARRPHRRAAPSLQVLRDPKVLAALGRAVTECVADGDGCVDPRECDHDANRMTPQDFFDWILLHTKPPPRPRPPLSQDRRARWKRRQTEGRRDRRPADQPSLRR